MFTFIQCLLNSPSISCLLMSSHEVPKLFLMYCMFRWVLLIWFTPCFAEYCSYDLLHDLLSSACTICQINLACLPFNINLYMIYTAIYVCPNVTTLLLYKTKWRFLTLPLDCLSFDCFPLVWFSSVMAFFCDQKI